MKIIIILVLYVTWRHMLKKKKITRFKVILNIEITTDPRFFFLFNTATMSGVNYSIVSGSFTDKNSILY